MGNEHISTPNIDRLARRGTIFNNAFVTTAICCSNRACILTGQHMYRHGIKDFGTPLSASAFDMTYPALLRKAGYRTGYMGKFAVGGLGDSIARLSLPASKFDDWYGFPQNFSYRQEINGQARYLTTVMTERAIQFLRATTPEQPFCLTVAFKEPHGPFKFFDPETPNIYENVELPPSPTFTQRDWDSQPSFIRESLNGFQFPKLLRKHDLLQERIRTFYRAITRADAAVGAILNELKRLGLDDNTVVIFSSDHGSLMGDHGLHGKWLMYENSIRVPLIIYDPRIDPKHRGERRDALALTIDLAPTMLALAGIKPPASMQGKSLLSSLEQEPSEWRSRFYYQHVYKAKPPKAPIPVTEGIRTQRWKYIRYPETQPVFEQLFDLKSDPLEQVNLVTLDEHSAILEQLRSQCELDPKQR